MKASRAVALAAGILSFGVVAVTPTKSIAATYTVEFSATNFSPSDPSAPADPFQGSVTLTFDPTVNGTGSVILNAINIPFAGPVGFRYLLANNTLLVGGAIGGPEQAAIGFDDFALRFSDFLGTPTFVLASITQSSGSQWLSQTGTVSVAEIPLPAALPLFATVLAGGGLIAWRRKRKAAAANAFGIASQRG